MSVVKKTVKTKRSHVLVTDFNGTSNVGLFCYATDKYCLVGRDVPENLTESIAEVLNVKVIRTTIAGTSLLGVFLSGNNKCLLIPPIVMPHELEILDKNKIKYVIIDTKHTCLGNNMICNDKGCLISSEYGEKEVSQIKKALKIDVVRVQIAELSTVGSLTAHSGKHMLCHHEILEEEADIIRKIMKVTISTGTVNMGSPFIGAGIFSNKYGFVIGESSGGPEIINADEALGFVK